MKKLTDKQQQIIQDTHFPNFLYASAGTGKTEVLIKKIIRLICDNKIELTNFAIVTFTNTATFEMQKRLYDELYNYWIKYNKNDTKKSNWIRHQIELCSMVQISTIHGLCDKILRNYGSIVGISPNFKISSFRQNTEDIINSQINSNRYSILKDFSVYKITKLIMNFMDSNNNKGLVIDNNCDFIFNEDNSNISHLKKEFIKLYINSYKIIETQKQNKNILTTNDLIKKTSQLLKNNFVSQQVSNNFKYLFVDEFQDVDRYQFDIVNSLIKCGTKAFIIGDDKQSIFRFRGADVNNAKQMSLNIAKYNNMNSSNSNLNENFRSDQKLIEYINKIFSHKFKYKNIDLNFPFQALAVPNNNIRNYNCKPLELSFNIDICNIINDLVKNQKLGNNAISYNDISILCRTNNEVDNVATILKMNNIPIEVIGGKGFYKSKEIIDIFKLLNATIYDNNNTKCELMFTDYYKAIKNSNSGLDINSFIEQLRTVLKNSTVESALSFIYEKSYIFDFYRSQNKIQAIANMIKLKNIAREMMNEKWLQPIEFLNHLNIMIASKKEEDEATIPSEERINGIVSISTIHKAKGMTFPIVILPYADKNLINKRNYPDCIIDTHDLKKIRFGIDISKLDSSLEINDRDYSALLDKEIISYLEEELRVFYVGLTRAKHKVIISCSKSRQNVFKNDNDTKISWIKWIYTVFNINFSG